MRNIEFNLGPCQTIIKGIEDLHTGECALLKKITIPDIYQYEHLSDFLKSYYSLSKSSSLGAFTLDKWSLKLGYQSPRVIAMVMKNQRSPSEEFQEKLIEYFNLNGNKKKYLELLRRRAVAEFKNQNSEEIYQELQRINPSNLELRKVSHDEFDYINDWHHLVIKQLTKIKDFRVEPAWIAKTLKNKISESKVTKSLKLLEKLGHVKKVNNTLKASTPIKTGSDIPSVAIKNHHDQMLARARESLFEDDMDTRFFYSLCMSFSREDLPEAQQMIQEFMNEFDARFAESTKDKKDIYQLGFQLFPHTKKERTLH